MPYCQSFCDSTGSTIQSAKLSQRHVKIISRKHEQVCMQPLKAQVRLDISICMCLRWVVFSPAETVTRDEGILFSVNFKPNFTKFCKQTRKIWWVCLCSRTPLSQNWIRVKNWGHWCLVWNTAVMYYYLKFSFSFFFLFVRLQEYWTLKLKLFNFRQKKM